MSFQGYFISVQVCVEPDANIPHGELLFIHNGTIPAGAVARFSCEEGYKLTGPESKECLEGQGWVPSEDVVCSKV